jgi:site-specific recombinase XerD
MSKRSVVKVVGPLAPYAAGWADELKGRGYTDLSVDGHLRLVVHASRWLAAGGLEAEAFTPERIEEFSTDRKAAGYSSLHTMRAIEPLRGYLEAQGVLLPPPAHDPENAEEHLLDRYRSYLVCERSLVEQVVAIWMHAAARFLADHPGLADGGTEVGVAEVSAFCVRELTLQNRSSARNSAAALRSFLRFLHVEGVVAAPLAQAVPAVANRKGAGLPRGVSPATISQLLASCDRRTRLGRRDYAILLLLARLGLRAGEVARMALEDIDWCHGELIVHGKGNRDQRLPLPADVGAAVAGYLQRGRQRCDTRTVFLRAIAPTVGLSPVGITWVVYSACERACVPKFGAHRLRHSAATEMLRAGASLIEVGQVLRHANVGTTAIYAKVDFASLRLLAPSWPGSAA